MRNKRCLMFAGLVPFFVTAAGSADEYVTYVGAIDVNESLERIVADPVRPMVYGITDDGAVVFINRDEMSVDNVVRTGRLLRDIICIPAMTPLPCSITSRESIGTSRQASIY